MIKYVAFDQFGNTIKLHTNHPRKELMEHFGTKHADKMYREAPLGVPDYHVGYVVAGHWCDVYKATPLNTPKS